MPNLDPLKGTVTATESTQATQGAQTIKVALSKPIPRLDDIYFTFILDSLKALPLGERITHIKQSGATPVLQEKFFKRMAYDVMNRRSDVYTSPEAVISFFKEIKALCSFREEGQENPTYDSDHFFTYFFTTAG